MQAEDIGWLAGIIDGEGCLAVRPHPAGCGRGSSVYLHVASTCVPLLEKVVRILREMGAVSVSRIRTHSGPSRREKWTPAYQVTLTNRNELMAVLKVITPHLTDKKAFCEAVIVFYQNHAYRTTWTDEDVQAMAEIRRTYQARFTARNSPTLSGNGESQG